MKNLITTICLLSITSVAFSQKGKDIAALNQLCGCFEVDFKYAETFSPNKDYKFHDRYTAGALELALPIEISKDKFVIQHLLIVNDTMVIKHWREDWFYENKDLLLFEGDSKWTKVKADNKETKGTWTQKVYGTTDEPRYEGLATWTHADGTSQWHNIADSPLPRREYSKRKDYNIMNRGNTIVINETGYTHEQDNDKIKREENERTLIASEKGYNIYTKTDASKCKAAELWWDKNQSYWATIVKAWDTVLADRVGTVELKQFVRTKLLYATLDKLQEENLTPEETYTKAVDILGKYLAPVPQETLGKL